MNTENGITLNDVIGAEVGDGESLSKILSHFCECVELELTPNSVVMTYLANGFQSYLDGNSFDKAFSLIGDVGRPADELLERNALVVTGMAYEKSQGENDLDAFENVGDRHCLSGASVKKIWQEKPDEVSSVTLRSLIDDKDIDRYVDDYTVKKQVNKLK